MNKSNNSVGFLQIVFITLKLTNFINWSWWWVMSPLIACGLIAVLVFLAIAWHCAKNNLSDDNMGDA